MAALCALSTKQVLKMAIQHCKKHPSLEQCEPRTTQNQTELYHDQSYKPAEQLTLCQHNSALTAFLARSESSGSFKQFSRQSEPQVNHLLKASNESHQCAAARLNTH